MEHLSPMMTYYTYSMHECEVPRYPLPFETANFLSRITKTLSHVIRRNSGMTKVSIFAIRTTPILKVLTCKLNDFSG